MPDMLQSKKFIASIVAAVLALIGFYLGLTVEQIAIITGPLMVYVGAQGLADFGKERAIIEKIPGDVLEVNYDETSR